MAVNKPTIALVTGCFDLLHPGHIKFLRFAASKANKLLVGVESDQLVSQHKTPSRPIFPAKDRLLVLSELKSISQIFLIKPHTDYQKLLKKLKIDYLIISRKDNLWEVKHQICQNLGIKLFIYPRLSQYSTSNIIQKIKACDSCII
ncbi:MAG: adenylyltransferase/cytidyltransferase family protein [Patescibacteria group bacterium]|mgnify:CR=1 FL=1